MALKKAAKKSKKVVVAKSARKATTVPVKKGTAKGSANVKPDKKPDKKPQKKPVAASAKSVKATSTQSKSVQKSPKKGPAPKKVKAEVLDLKAKPVECEIIDDGGKSASKVVDCEIVDHDTPVDRLKPAAVKGAKASAPVKPTALAKKIATVEVLEPEDHDASEDSDAPAAPIEPEIVDGEPHIEWDPEHEFVDHHEEKKKKIFKKVKKTALVPVDTKSLTTATDSITAYLNEVRKYPLLTKEQEIELAKRYFDTKDPVAAQALVTANLRFVVKVAAEYSKYGARLIDLIQEGNMGLMHAVRDFNPYKGVRLITYAVWWIRGYIQEYLLKQYSMVKIATTQNQKRLFYRLQKEKDALDSMGETPDMSVIGEKMGIPTAEVEQMANRLSGRDVSLNAPLDDSSSSSLMDLQKSTESGVDDQIAAQEEINLLREKLEEMRDQMSEREKIILDERLLADEPLTLQEIGEKYGITREAVRQMEARLMKKIRDRYISSLAAVTEED